MSPATASTQRFFRKAAPEGEENTNEWHAYRDDGNTSLCGEAQLTYNVDSIADAVPQTGTLHLGCREALAVEQQPQAEAEAAAAVEARDAAETEAAVAEAESIVGGEGAEGSETQVIGEGDVATVDAATPVDPVTDLNPAEGGEPTTEETEPSTPDPNPEAPAEGAVIDGDDGTAPATEPDPVP